MRSAGPITRLSDIEPDFVWTACGKRGAEVRPKFSRARMGTGELAAPRAEGPCGNARMPKLLRPRRIRLGLKGILLYSLLKKVFRVVR